MVTHSSNSNQRRRYARVPCRMIVERVGPTVDLSEGGLRVLSAHPLAHGADLPLTFELPEIGTLVRCQGAVVHVTRSRYDHDLVEMGVTFKDLPEAGREQIMSYIAARDRKSVV